MENNPYHPPGTSDDVVSVAPPRKIRAGVIVVGILCLHYGMWKGGQNVLMLSDLYSNATGPVFLSRAFILHLAGEFWSSILAIVSAVGLFVGARWGWWLGSFFWCWRISNEVLLPLSMTFLAGQSVETAAGESLSAPTALGRFVFLALPLVYLHRASVLDFFRITAPGRFRTVLVISGVAIVLSVVWRLLTTALS